MDRNELEPYRQFARPFYAGKDPAHDFSHIERILSRLDLFSQGLADIPRPDRLYFLACFHGLWRRLCQDESFLSQVRGFLINLGWTEEAMVEVFQSLAHHTTRPQSVEEQIVHDADQIESLGALGIAKTFATGGARGQTILETANYFEHRILPRSVFYTPAGKRLAEERCAYTLAFLSSLRAEF